MPARPHFLLHLPAQLRKRVERVKKRNPQLTSLTATMLHLLVIGLRVEEAPQE